MLILTIATVLFGGFLILRGCVMAFAGKEAPETVLKILYNRPAGIIVWSLGIIWTLIETLKLGVSDFGSFKIPLFILFLGLGIASVWMLRDYLIVRGMSIISLLLAWWFLKAAFLQPEWTRLFLVVPVYLWIISALWLAVAPWRARDIVMWIKKDIRHQLGLGWGQIAYGILLFIVAATYRFVA